MCNVWLKFQIIGYKMAKVINQIPISDRIWHGTVHMYGDITCTFKVINIYIQWPSRIVFSTFKKEEYPTSSDWPWEGNKFRTPK